MRIRAGLGALALGVALAATGCGGKKGPGDEEAAAAGFGEEGVGEGEELAGRSAEGLAEARRMGLRTIYFDYDDSSLREDARSDLQHNADILKRNSGVRIEIQGNCDERGSNEYNFALGERRAKSARDFLVQLGVGSGQLSTVSFGEENATVVGHNESAWSKNRRADFAVVR
jgi:peptidoglycan-associated lipoprotein